MFPGRIQSQAQPDRPQAALRILTARDNFSNVVVTCDGLSEDGHVKQMSETVKELKACRIQHFYLIFAVLQCLVNRTTYSEWLAMISFGPLARTSPPRNFGSKAQARLARPQ